MKSITKAEMEALNEKANKFVEEKSRELDRMSIEFGDVEFEDNTPKKKKKAKKKSRIERYDDLLNDDDDVSIEDIVKNEQLVFEDVRNELKDSILSIEKEIDELAKSKNENNIFEEFEDINSYTDAKIQNILLNTALAQVDDIIAGANEAVNNANRIDTRHPVNVAKRLIEMCMNKYTEGSEKHTA